LRSEIAEDIQCILGNSSRSIKIPISSFAQYPHNYSTDGHTQHRQLILLTPANSMPRLDHGFSKELICIRIPRSSSSGRRAGDEFVLGVASLRNTEEYSIDEILKIGTNPGALAVDRDSVTTVEVNVTLLKDSYEALENVQQLRWYHLCGLIPALRKYQACCSSLLPEFASTIVRCTPKPWPAEPPVDPERQRRTASLNPLQRSVVNTMCTTADSGLYNLIGPPGTGKTSTIVHLLAERVRCFPTQKILLTAPSNKAVHVLLDLLMRTMHTPPMLAYVGVAKSLEWTGTSAADYHAYLIQPYATVITSTQASLSKLHDALHAAHEESIKRLRNLILSEGLTAEAHIRAPILTLLQELTRHTTTTESCQSIDALVEHTKEIVSHIHAYSYALEQYILQKAHIVFATLVTSGGNSLYKTVQHFDCVIVDEAAQALIPETFIPFKFDPALCLLIGDPQQLPGLVHSTELRTLGYAESLMGVMTEGRQRPYLERLTTQYRMHPSICKWVSDQFNDGELVADAQLQSRATSRQRLPVTWPLSGLPSAFVDCDYREMKGKHGDISNTGEADAVMRTVKHLLRNGVAPHEIGIITFYSAQVQLLVELRSQLAKELPRVRDLAEKLTISTVDGFQGDERDIILISCVRSVPSVGFLNDHRRINVAMSRAKYARWVLGNAQALQGSKSVFGNYFRWVNSAMDNSAFPRTEILGVDALAL
jgi:senataxin